MGCKKNGYDIVEPGMPSIRFTVHVTLPADIYAWFEKAVNNRSGFLRACIAEEYVKQAEVVSDKQAVG